MRQTLDDRRLAHAGFADQYRVVFRPPGKHLHHAADFFVAADHGIELATPRLLGQIAGIAFQRLVFGFRILVGHLLRATNRGQGFEDRVVGGAAARQDFLGRVALALRNRQQQMLG